MNKTIILVFLFILFSITKSFAEDYKFVHINLMAAFEQKNPFNKSGKDQYVEIEIGGKSGRFELYGYIDFLDIAQTSKSDANKKSNMFAEIKPKFNILPDFNFGAVSGLYISAASLVDGSNGLWHNGIGLGTTYYGVGINLLAMHRTEDYGSEYSEKKWDGLKLAINWFKPIYNIKEGMFLAYQGYLNYSFLANNMNKNSNKTSNEFQSYQGFYLHSNKYSIGYGAKFYNNMAFFSNNNNLGFKSSGVGHYVAVTYKL